MGYTPYSESPARAYWRQSVADRSVFDIAEVWTPKYPLGEGDIFATYGSCFAQHFSKALRGSGLMWIDAEPAPSYASKQLCRDFNYGVFSSRTQNIYTPTMLLQWLRMSVSKTYQDYEVWAQDGRYYDPLRPSLEPNGFASKSEVISARERTCKSLILSVKQSTTFVFTLGLTERWLNTSTDMEYAQCPGVHVGLFNEAEHSPDNLQLPDLLSAMSTSFRVLRTLNPDLKVLLTVSPVPLAATFQDKHILVATVEAKSVLRTAASLCCQKYSYVDYFPSYELISSFPVRGVFYEPDLRTVNSQGVGFVMDIFFKGINFDHVISLENISTDEDIICEEILLDAFGGERSTS